MSETKKWLWLIALLIGIGITLWLFLSRGPEFLAQLLSSGMFIPLAMTTGKHDLPPLSKGQIAFGVIVAILILIIASITPPLP